MRGGGATPRSGRVRVFALRIVPEGPCLAEVVGIGMSSWWKPTVMVKKMNEGRNEGTLASQGLSEEIGKERVDSERRERRRENDNNDR